MRARLDGRRLECVHCGDVTPFERDVRGPKGRLVRYEICCVPCGESPARRAEFERKRKQTAA